jgi:DNA ligase-1
LIQERFQLRKPEKIQQAMDRQPVAFFAFDILRYKGEDLRGRTLPERKAILSQVFTPNKYFSHVISIEGAGNALFDVIRQKKIEGMVAKAKASKYVGRRDPNWLKIINYTYADVQIAGYRKDEFGWLLRHEDRAVGIVELAVPVPHKKAFYGIAKGIITGEDRNFVYVEPSIKAKVRFRNWTRKGMLRSPEFVNFVV